MTERPQIAASQPSSPHSPNTITHSHVLYLVFSRCVAERIDEGIMAATGADELFSVKNNFWLGHYQVCSPLCFV